MFENMLQQLRVVPLENSIGNICACTQAHRTTARHAKVSMAGIRQASDIHQIL